MPRVVLFSKTQKMRELEAGAFIEFKIIQDTEKQVIRSLVGQLQRREKEHKKYTVNYDPSRQIMRVTRIS